jgi:hypothetical protein
MDNLIEQLRDEHRHKGTLDTNDIAFLFRYITSLEARLEKLYTDCTIYPTGALRRNPEMLGNNDNAGWMKSDSVFKITHPGE